MHYTGIKNTLSTGSVHHRSSAAGIVDETVCIKHQVQILRGLRKEERLHPVLQLVIFHTFHLHHTIHDTINDRLTKRTALHGKPITEIWSITCHMGSHSVTCHPTQVNTQCLNPSQYLIYLPQRDGRLTGSQTCNLSILHPNHYDH